MQAKWKFSLAALGLLTAWGCGPPEIAPALPVGVELIEEIPEEDRAQALGETGHLSASQPPSSSPDARNAPLAEPTEPGEAKTTSDGVKYETLKAGEGAQAQPGQRVNVHYVGTLEDGQKFDSSRDRGSPFAFTLGAGEVIRGWDLGVAGMRIGETRRLTIPPNLGYGSPGSPPAIPPNATLIFEVELLGLE